MTADEPTQAQDSAPQTDDAGGRGDSEDVAFVDDTPTWWQRLRRMVYKLPVERYREQAQRLRELNWTIETYPDAASNYVLRGELYARMHRDAAARADFEHALALIREDDSRWGIIAQALQDRAVDGLAKLGG